MKNISKRITKIIGKIILALIVLTIMLAGIFRHAYFSPLPANLPCRNCEGEARVAVVDGFDLYYREIGNNSSHAPVVLIHGGPGQSSQSFKDGFDFLAEHHRVIFYDQRGSGNSQVKPQTDLYTIDLLVEELESLRRDMIRTEKMILIGHSAGGALTLRYAMKYPQHVEKLVLVCALSANGGMPIGGPLMEAMFASMNVLAGNVPPKDPLEADRQFNEMIFKANISRMYDPSRTDILQDMGYATFAVNRDITSSTMGGNFDREMRLLTFPTLIFYGAADHSPFTNEAVAQHFHETLPDSTLVRMKQSGHWPYLEEPETFQIMLLEFLSK